MTIGFSIFSGGLDSMLAARLLMDQGVDVRLITFVTPFFDAERAKISARVLGLETRAENITHTHLEMMSGPKHDFGRFMNPCIDCHALMFKRAGEIMTAEGGDFLFSGEVLGQRPKSQNRRALGIVAEESGWAEFILRPLSAKVLPATRMEENGLIDRSRLAGFSGRSRKPQMAMAEQFGIKDYPTPAGGCLLTDPIFSRRLRELYDISVHLSADDAALLKWGRHFRLPGGGKLVVGRKREENEILAGLARPGDLVFHTIHVPGPLVILRGGAGEDIETAVMITASYSDSPSDQACLIRVKDEYKAWTVETSVLPKSEFAHWMV